MKPFTALKEAIFGSPAARELANEADAEIAARRAVLNGLRVSAVEARAAHARADAEKSAAADRMNAVQNASETPLANALAKLEESRSRYIDAPSEVSAERYRKAQDEYDRETAAHASGAALCQAAANDAARLEADAAGRVRELDSQIAAAEAAITEAETKRKLAHLRAAAGPQEFHKRASKPAKRLFRALDEAIVACSELDQAYAFSLAAAHDHERFGGGRIDPLDHGHVAHALAEELLARGLVVHDELTFRYAVSPDPNKDGLPIAHTTPALVDTIFKSLRAAPPSAAKLADARKRHARQCSVNHPRDAARVELLELAKQGDPDAMHLLGGRNMRPAPWLPAKAAPAEPEMIEMPETSFSHLLPVDDDVEAAPRALEIYDPPLGRAE